MYDIITMGSNTVDIFAHTDRAQMIDIKSEEGNKEFLSYPVGSKMLVTRLLHNFGGNGSNTAVCFSRLGFKTGYIGKVGKDNNGKTIISGFKKEKIDFLGARGEESGLSIILDAMEEDRTILVYKGCNNDLKFKELKTSRLKTKWLYISSMLGESLATMQKVAELVKKNKGKISFNPSATLIENETQAALKLARLADILVLNKEEAESLVGPGSPEANIMRILSMGPNVVAITDGKNGALAFKDKCLYKIMPRQDLKVVETTGAGDAFAATLTAGIILEKPFEQCLKMAINNSESVITGHGAQPRLLTRKKMLELTSQDTRPIEKKKV
jgi:ribokinase